MIEVIVNGQPRKVKNGSTITALLEDMALQAERVAVERNKLLVKKTDHAHTPLQSGDQVEIVHFVGGG